MNDEELESYIEKINLDLTKWAKNLEECKNENILDIVPKSKYKKSNYKFAHENNFTYFPPYICE